MFFRRFAVNLTSSQRLLARKLCCTEPWRSLTMVRHEWIIRTALTLVSDWSNWDNRVLTPVFREPEGRPRLSQTDALAGFLPAVSEWFRDTFGETTPPQEQGWPAIASGQNTLIFAPTGSGKTLAAFLACLDHLWKTPRTAKGVRILYVSPLKALNQDISRNLQLPLEGILAKSEAMGRPLTPLTVAVRTGDTKASDRQKMVRRPPDILITTPESLHLLLTSAAREMLRTVSHVIVDEIHALCPNKRGVFFAILLERLEAIAPGFVRVGLSATQRPLEEVARYLGGSRKVGPDQFEARHVTIVDAGRRKQIDLEVSFPARLMGPQPQGSIWPAIEESLLQLIRSHRSTIVFANNRRVVERLTTHLNEQAELDGTTRVIARAHHGSLHQDARRQTEELLKSGELPAVIATASLELGIDMGAVDLVCQVESAGGIARGLQRVGRAGHLVGRTSKGRLFAKTAGDLVETAALACAMIEGNVETLRVPSNCLDVLAQQIVACVAVDRWSVPALFDLIRGAYPYRDLAPTALEGVLKMISGRFAVEAIRDLKPRISWDRVHNTLRPLPGSKHLAVVGGGTIPDTGQYPLYLGEGGPRLGELDEEFVLERRVGETFMLGSSTWQITAIDPQRVVVAAAGGRSALMPFWRGEGAGRTAELGRAVGELCREVAARRNHPDVLIWLKNKYRVDDHAAEALVGLISRQIRHAGAVPDDRTVLVEAFKDPAGELGLAVLTPFGHKLHHALKLVLGARLRDRLGIEVAGLHDDDGVLFRLPAMDNPPLDLFEGLSADEAAGIVRDELADSALFGLRFRQNAGRSLLMPRPDPGKRAPLWLQRLRAKDLLQAVRRFPDFPVVIETYRECLDDDLDLPRMRKFLDDIASGQIRVATRNGEIPSPFTSELTFRFTLKYLYEWDDPVRSDRRPGPIVADEDLDPVLDPSSRRMWLEPEAVRRVDSRLRGSEHPPRSVDEMAEWLRGVGDLSSVELNGPMLGFLETLRAEGRAVLVELPKIDDSQRWIGAEEVSLYESAFASGHSAKNRDEARSSIISRYLRTRALIGLDELLARYPLDPASATDFLERLSDEGRLIHLGPDEAGRDQWADKKNLEDVRLLSIAIKRREGGRGLARNLRRVADSPPSYSPAGLGFRARRRSRLSWKNLQGFAATTEMWESQILPQRIADFRPSWLETALASGNWQWRAEGSEPRVAIVARDFAGTWPSPTEPS